MWQKYCGFLDFSLEDFMDTQRHLLMEQVELLSNCELGQTIMRGARPSSVEEFRAQVPLTTYEDYAPFLLRRRDEGLPDRPIFWQRTSGRSDEYRFKWIPVTERLYAEVGTYIVAWAILSSCRERGDIAYRDHDKLFYGMAPPPYPTGAMARVLHRELVLDVFPPMGKAERMAFTKRMEQGVSIAMCEGLDYVFALSSVLVALGEQMSREMEGTALSFALRHPRAFPRLLNARVRSRLSGRPLYPKDLWKLKGLACTGTDTAAYRESIARYWGRYPLETYACAEAGILAMQAWDYRGLTFVPNIVFLEFIPEEEHLRSKEDPSYQPATVLLDEVEAGKRYELAFTSFYGVPFTRYRIGDMIHVTALRNERLGIELPQIAVDDRVDGIIDIGGFARLTAGAIGRAIDQAGVPYEGWTVRKEVEGGKTVLHVYIELTDGASGDFSRPSEVRYAIHKSLKDRDHDYAAIEDMLGFKPIRVTVLPEGSFARYTEMQRKNGDRNGSRPPHLNPTVEAIEKLLGMKDEVVSK